MGTLEALREKVQAQRRLPSPEVRRALRVDAGVSQEDIARAVGVRRETVSKWETGQRTPRGQLLIDYVEALRALQDGAG